MKVSKTTGTSPGSPPRSAGPVYIDFSKMIKVNRRIALYLEKYFENLHAYVYFIAYAYLFWANFTCLLLFKSLRLLDTLE